MEMKPRPQTQSHYQQLSQVTPGGVNSPIRAFQSLKLLPMVAEKGLGDLIFDVDGYSYIDYCMSWGALIHGHAHPQITSTLIQGVTEGTTFGVTTPFEERLASKMVSLIDSLEMVRFVSSGTEATMSAVRLARGYTNRKLILKFDGNYHGHADHFLVRAGSAVAELKESSSKGIPAENVQCTLSLPYNDSASFEALLQDSSIAANLAAIIVEPVAANMGVVPASPAFLELLRRKSQEVGALLIFDEVISGFRLGLNGAQGSYQIAPDLTCYGKIIGGGLPAAAFGGKKEIMQHLAPLGPVFQAGTLSGNPLAMRAGLKAIELLERPSLYLQLEEKAQVIAAPIEELILKEKLNLTLNRFQSLFTLFFGVKEVKEHRQQLQADENLFAQFYAFLFDHGIFAPPAQNEAWFVSTAHETKHLEKTRDLILTFLKANKERLV